MRTSNDHGVTHAAGIDGVRASRRGRFESAVVGGDRPDARVEHREDVGSLRGVSRRAGAGMLGPAYERPWGIYCGYLADPDDHLWEVICILPRVPA